MKLSEIIQEVEDWLVWFTYSFEITGCEQCFNGDYRVRFVEYTPNGESSDEETFTVTQNGKLINSNGDDVTEIQLDESDPDCVQWVRDFRNQWYKPEEEKPMKGTFHGDEFISKRGIKYSVYEGKTLDGNFTSDIVFIMNDCYEDAEFVGWFYGATFLYKRDQEFIDSLEYYINKYEDEHPEVIEKCISANELKI